MIAFLSRAYRAPLILLTVVAWPVATATASVLINPAAPLVVAQDNRKPAGSLEANVLTLNLRAGRGVWRPEGPTGPAVTIEALGETASSLSVPAPMIRVPEGTTIVASVRNELEAALVVRGLCARDGSPCAPLSIPAGETGRIEFQAGQPGTYHYWATTMAVPVPFREMGGAFIVDPREGAVPDRVLVITEWSSLSPQQIGSIIAADVPGEAFSKANPRFVFVINGLSWPASERMTYQVGESVRWRVINLSSQHHPMHLHGFYFNVESSGNGLRDQPVADADRHAVVTHLLRSDATMMMTWTPEREGNWLFHCHIMHHVSPERRFVEPARRPAEAHDSHGGHDGGDPSGGMAGMIIGVTVVKPAAATSKVSMPETGRAARRLTLDMVRDSTGREPRLGFALAGDGVAADGNAARVSSPGPVLVLRRNEPVEITVRNQLAESTAVHWHGMELDSIYDGVHGFSGVGKKRSPMIEPGGSFVVRFTPPRTGTFIYHTHLHDHRQLPLGLYGAMIVVDGDAAFDPDVDHVVVLGRSGLDPAVPDVVFPTIPVVINGETGPRSVWKAGLRHRVRLINITPDDILVVAMESAQGLTKWQPVSKDGTPLPERLRAKAPARQTIAVGETYDFEIELPPFPQNLWLDVRSTAGKWHAQAHVIVK
jgi:FtsP/CotA-like multicopper oxidase with cupredoxin domain